MKFASGKGIIVYGTLDAEDVTLTASGTSWDGITLSGSSASASIHNSTISKATTGLYVQSASGIPTVTGSIITNSGSYAIHVNSGSVDVYDSQLTNSGSHGVYVQGGDITLTNSTVSGNGGSGVRLAYGVSGLRLGCCGDNGYNVLTGNGSHGVYANASSLTLGIAPSVVLPDGYAGYNSIYANTGKDMYLTNGSDVRAEQHWWGESPPSTSDFHISGTSTLDYTPYLGSNPNMAMSVAANVRAGTSEALGLAEVEAGQSVLEQPASAPMAETAAGEAGISTKSQSSKGQFVREIMKRRAEQGRAASAEALLRAASERGNPLAYLAQVFAVGDLLYLGRTQEAILLGEAVLQSGQLDAGATSVVAQALLWAYEDVLKDEANAARIRQVLALAGEASETNAAIANLGDDQLEADQEAVGLQSGAYPNPFNPEVSIHYALPQEGRVRLRVFDVLGRQVATLVDEVQQAGRHRVRFVASDLPSGVYLYRIEAGGQMQTGRLVLQK